MKIRIDKEYKTKYFSILLAMFPLLTSYRSPIPGVDAGSFLLLVFAVFAASFKWYKTEINSLIIYILLTAPIMAMVSKEHSLSILLIIMRYAKIIVTLGFVFGMGFSKKYYDEKIVFRTMKKVIYICTVYIVAQRIFHLFGSVLVNPLTALSTDDAYIYGYTMGANSLFRPSGFFLEPAHLSVYGLVFLLYSLFKEDNIKHAFIVTVAILCSGSGIGLVICVMLYGMYFLVRFKKHWLKTIIVFFAGVSAVAGMSRMSFFNQVVSRFTTSNLGGGQCDSWSYR